MCGIRWGRDKLILVIGMEGRTMSNDNETNGGIIHGNCGK